MNKMKEFTYSTFYKLLYRFGNIPVTLILLVYLFVFSAGMHNGYFYILLVVVTAYLIYKVNRLYLELYKILPAKITSAEEELICSDFFLKKNKEIRIKYEDIGKLDGGVFQSKLSGLMRIHDTRNNICIGFYPRMNNSRILVTILLNKVPKEVYEAAARKMGLDIKH